MPDDDDDGGRLAQQGLELAGRPRSNAAGPSAAAGGGQDARPRLFKATQILIDRCQLLQMGVRPGAPDVHLASDIAAAFATVVAALDEKPGRLGPGEIMQVNFCLFALARLGTMVAERDRPSANAMAAGLASRLHERGAPMSPDIPGSRVVADSGDESNRLHTIQAAVAARVDALLLTMKETTPHAAVERSIAAEVPMLVQLLREARGSALALRERGSGVTATTLKLTDDKIAELAARGRQLGVRQAPAMLDLAFDAEDDAIAATGAPLPNWRHKYYADLNATDFDGDAKQRDGHAKTGGQLVDQIIAWFEGGTVIQTMLLKDIADIVNEPPAKREPSTLEKVIAFAVQSVLGLIPAYLNDVLTGGLRGMLAAKPAVAAVSPVYSDTPQARAPIGSDFRIVNEITLAAQPMLGRTLARDVQKALGGPISATDSQPAPATLPASGANGPISRLFINQLTAEAIASMATRIGAASGMRAALELVPPAELARLYAGLTEAAVAKANDARADLVMRWSTVVSAATNGVEDDGTVASFGGTIAQGGETPGSLQLDIVVHSDEPQEPSIFGQTGSKRRRVSPEIETRSVRLNGLGPTGLATLRDAKRPIHAVAMNRIFNVTAIGADGNTYNAGRFDVGPEGQLDLRFASLSVLAQIGRNQPVGGASPSMEDVLTGVAYDDAATGARMILNFTGKTTEAIQ